MTETLDRFRRKYSSAFDIYLAEGGEAALRGAYELGREAVSKELSVLELATIHHDVLLAALNRAEKDAEVERVARAAAEFLLESLSAFEMVQRGFREAREAALLEKRHAAMLRQLSNFLADTSLAINAADSLEEMLRLVAEQAREVIGAHHCVVRVTFDDDGTQAIQASSQSEIRADWGELVREDRLSELFSRIEPTGRAVRLAQAELAGHPLSRGLAGAAGAGRPVHGLLVAPLTGLDRRHLGFIQLLDKYEGDFSEADEAILVQLAQLTSAAVERMRLYGRERRIDR